MTKKIKLGLYEHYKGLKYEVIGICKHSETLEELVVYRTLYADYRLWVRPYDMFMGKVNIEGKEIDRFRFVKPLFEIPPKGRQ